MGSSVFTNENPHCNVPVRNFEHILELAQGESFSLGRVSAIMDIIWDMEAGLVLKTFPGHKGNEMSIETSPTNNNIFFIGIIDFNASILKSVAEILSIIM